MSRCTRFEDQQHFSNLLHLKNPLKIYPAQPAAARRAATLEITPPFLNGDILHVGIKTPRGSRFRNALVIINPGAKCLVELGLNPFRTG